LILPHAGQFGALVTGAAAFVARPVSRPLPLSFPSITPNRALQSKLDNFVTLRRKSPTDQELSTLMLTKGTVNCNGQPL